MKQTNIYGNTINIDKKNIIRNESGAAFYKNIDGMESYYHICDDIQKRITDAAWPKKSVDVRPMLKQREINEAEKTA